MAVSKQIILTVLIFSAAGLASCSRVSSSLDKSTSQRKFTFTYSVTLPNLPEPAKRLEIFLPIPSGSDVQELSDVRVTSPLEYEIHSDEQYANRYLYFSAESSPPLPVEISVSIDITRSAHITDASDQKTTENAQQDDPGRFLESNQMVPITGRIAAEADSVVKRSMTPYQSARAVYDHLLATMRYDKSGVGWGKGDALFACETRRGNCTDIHSLFIAMMRSQKIPARFIIGFTVPRNQVSGKIEGYHCWAEFYSPVVGWVPVDISEALKHPERQEFFFGNLDKDRVAFSIGRDILLNSHSGTDTLNYFIYPHILADGQPNLVYNHSFTFNTNLP